MLLACLQIRYKADVNKQAVFKSYLNAYLTDSLKKGLAFDISDCAADLCDDNISVAVLAYRIDE